MSNKISINQLYGLASHNLYVQKHQQFNFMHLQKTVNRAELVTVSAALVT